jgi:hypothetical protein
MVPTPKRHSRRSRRLHRKLLRLHRRARFKLCLRAGRRRLIRQPFRRPLGSRSTGCRPGRKRRPAQRPRRRVPLSIVRPAQPTHAMRLHAAAFIDHSIVRVVRTSHTRAALVGTAIGEWRPDKLSPAAGMRGVLCTLCGYSLGHSCQQAGPAAFSLVAACYTTASRQLTCRIRQ